MVFMRVGGDRNKMELMFQNILFKLEKWYFFVVEDDIVEGEIRGDWLSVFCSFLVEWERNYFLFFFWLVCRDDGVYL